MMEGESKEEWTGEKEEGVSDGNQEGERSAETKHTYMTASSGDKYAKERKRAARQRRERERDEGVVQ